MIHRVMSVEICRAKTKVYHLDEGYACVQKTRNFTKDPKEEI